MAVSQFVERKLDRRFDTYDLDGSGQIEQNDFEVATQRVAASFGVAGDSPKIQRLREVLNGIWEQLAAACDTDGDGRISRDEYKTAFIDHVLVDKDAYAKNYQPFIDTMMSIADSDGDGRIDQNEYVKWFTALMSIPDDEAAEAFTHLDRDGDRYLTGDEITNAVVEYYFSDDPDAPGNWVTGRPPTV